MNKWEINFLLYLSNPTHLLQAASSTTFISLHLPHFWQRKIDMYPTSNSSSASQTSGGDPNNINGSNVNGGGGGAQQGLARYRSAPVSFLTTTVDSVINGQTQHTTVGNHNMVGGGGTPTRFFSPPDSTSSQLSTGDRLQTTSFRLNEFATAFNGLKGTSQTPSPLFRHGSSPAGFLNTLVSSTPTGSSFNYIFTPYFTYVSN